MTKVERIRGVSCARHDDMAQRSIPDNDIHQCRSSFGL